MGVAPAALPLVSPTPAAHLTWVIGLLRAGSSLPAEAIERTAAALCRSLKSSTLGDYIRFATACEKLMGAPLATWVGMDDSQLHALVT